MLMLGALLLEAVVLGVGTGLAAICTFGGGPMLSMTQLATAKIHIKWLQSHAQSSCNHNYIVYCTSSLHSLRKVAIGEKKNQYLVPELVAYA